jgi:hypothetical protein
MPCGKKPGGRARRKGSQRSPLFRRDLAALEPPQKPALQPVHVWRQQRRQPFQMNPELIA